MDVKVAPQRMLSYRRIDTFELCWRKLLSVLWTTQISNQSTLKEINSEYSLEGLMLKLQYFGYLMWRADSLENTPILRKIEGNRRRGWQRLRWLESITNSMDMNLSKHWETVEDRGGWHAAVHRVTKSRTPLSAELNWKHIEKCLEQSRCSANVYHWMLAITIYCALPTVQRNRNSTYNGQQQNRISLLMSIQTEWGWTCEDLTL